MVILEYMDFQNMITKNGNLSQTSVFYLCTQYYIYMYMYIADSGFIYSYMLYRGFMHFTLSLNHIS